jgi:hypothetical protein
MSAETKIDRIIKPDTEFAQKIGFIKDKFSGWLWEDGKYMWISFIESKQEHQGNLRQLFDKIEELGYIIIVPTPFDRMEMICRKRGMVKRLTKIQNETVEIMVKIEEINNQ